jgi:multicomponent Na+:H+ antiporter subunit B
VRSLILRVIAMGVLPITTLFAIYLLLRGHNAPGGGFIAGLVTASGVILQALAFGREWTQRRLLPFIRPGFAVGLLVAAVAILIPPFVGHPVLTHYHWFLPLPGEGYVHLSTTLIFDIGVYMVVVSTVVIALATFAEAAE